MWDRLRPTEWVAIAYGLYAVARIVMRGRAGSVTLLPSQHIPIVIVVLAIRLWREYTALPWQDPGRARAHRRMAPVFGGVTLLGAAASFQGDVFKERGLAKLVMVVLDVWLWIGGAAGMAALLWLAMGIRQKTDVPLVRVLRERLGPALRDWLPLLALLYAYGVSEAVGPFFRDLDPELAAIDRLMFGGSDPVMLAERIVHPALSEWLAGCYVFYALVYPIVLGTVYVLRDARAFQETCFALCLTLAIGYVFYNLVPAKGPLFTETFHVKLDLYYTGAVKEQLMDATRITRDCFPSLHTGAALVLLVAALRHVRKLGLAILPLVVSIPFACVYLRYHYVVDVLAGILLCGVAWAVTLKMGIVKAGDRPARGNPARSP
jgi:membrane-associated phospholipid phosphatase